MTAPEKPDRVEPLGPFGLTAPYQVTVDSLRTALAKAEAAWTDPLLVCDSCGPLRRVDCDLGGDTCLKCGSHAVRTPFATIDSLNERLAKAEELSEAHKVDLAGMDAAYNGLKEELAKAEGERDEVRKALGDEHEAWVSGRWTAAETSARIATLEAELAEAQRANRVMRDKWNAASEEAEAAREVIAAAKAVVHTVDSHGIDADGDEYEEVKWTVLNPLVGAVARYAASRKRTPGAQRPEHPGSGHESTDRTGQGEKPAASPCWKCGGDEMYCYTCGEREGACVCGERNMGDCEECAARSPQQEASP